MIDIPKIYEERIEKFKEYEGARFEVKFEIKLKKDFRFQNGLRTMKFTNQNDLLDQLKHTKNISGTIQKYERTNQYDDELSQDFLSIDETARLLRVHYNTIRNKIKSGELKAYKLGNSYRIKRTDLQFYLKGLFKQDI